MDLVIIGVAIVVCFGLIGLTYWAVVTKKYEDGDLLEKVQHMSNLSSELVETAILYKQMGMDKESEEAMEEAVRLDTMVWGVINGDPDAAKNI